MQTEQTEQQIESTIKFMTWNLPGGYRDNSSWNDRVDRILRLIAEIKPDIACFQKITGRDLRNKFISDLTQIGYEVIHAQRNANEICTSNLIIYNPDKFNYTKIKNIQLLSDDKYVPDDTTNANGFGANLLLVHFSCYDENITGKEFVVGNTHFPMDKLSRIDCSHKLAQWFEKNKTTKYIIGGALNSYIGNGYDEQIEIIQNFTTIVENEGMCGDMQISGSFLGSENDKFKCTAPNLDPVDHIMYNPDYMSHSNTIFDGRTMLKSEPPTLSTRDLPSDHLPKIVDITFQ
ncbi:hypothetical protein QLL95_gp0128 [Cotonvirus japonicus]|uniref:Endonuclease/exonuclease/phosphatase domain-containing protein n=1 Tax=Cotonvirus japonicus TaxID=2811091 RepID=A0ABM7NR99_9VIRU|nr:hypothetical protein QLL95_gp0128 [Cotonvirus japonicus]BCS82617.1 hypothetical protein [Cotonvirus japonicus]